MEKTISKDDLVVIKTARKDITIAELQLQVAKERAQNLILRVFNKYELNVDKYQITEDGTIVEKEINNE